MKNLNLHLAKPKTIVFGQTGMVTLVDLGELEENIFNFILAKRIEAKFEEEELLKKAQL